MKRVGAPSLADALGVGCGDLVSLVGGGGKTTLMMRLAGELRSAGLRAAAGTTTKIFPPGPGEPGELVVAGSPGALERALEAWRWTPGRFPVLGRRLAHPGKVEGVDPGWCRGLVREGLLDALALEADGSARRPVKAPEPWEPVVPGGTTVFVAVVGLTCLGRPFDGRTAFRLERMAEVTGLRPGEPISPDALVRLLTRPDGLAKGCPPGARAVAVLNQADAPGAAGAAREVARGVLAGPGRFGRVAITRLTAGEPVEEVLEREEPV